MIAKALRTFDPFEAVFDWHLRIINYADGKSKNVKLPMMQALQATIECQRISFGERISFWFKNDYLMSQLNMSERELLSYYCVALDGEYDLTVAMTKIESQTFIGNPSIEAVDADLFAQDPLSIRDDGSCGNGDLTETEDCADDDEQNNEAWSVYRADIDLGIELGLPPFSPEHRFDDLSDLEDSEFGDVWRWKSIIDLPVLPGTDVVDHGRGAAFRDRLLSLLSKKRSAIWWMLDETR